MYAVHQDHVELLRLALTRARFDADAADRIRSQILSGLAFAAKDPNRVAGEAFVRHAFPDHPYGRPSSGTVTSVRNIAPADLHDMRKRLFTRDTLRVAVVGDIDAKTLGEMLDRVFGDLPAVGVRTVVPEIKVAGKGRIDVIELDVPQSVAVFGLPGYKRKDADFMTAFVLNHILGGGGFSSRLMTEVREKRGLAYSVYSYLQTMQSSSLFAGGVATKNEEIARSLEVIRDELRRLAKDGPTPEELANAKSYLTGSFALRFDTSTKIASQLLGIQMEELGKDYINTRNSQIEAVTLDGVKRVARDLLRADDLLVTVVGKPKGLVARAGG